MTPIWAVTSQLCTASPRARVRVRPTVPVVRTTHVGPAGGMSHYCYRVAASGTLLARSRGEQSNKGASGRRSQRDDCRRDALERLEECLRRNDRSGR
jgi:hypothetical protein